MTKSLPAGVTLFERGWLSANNILLVDEDSAVLVDSGYYSHRAQTAALVSHALGSRPLDILVNTHLHSDHCGGNAVLQASYSSLRTLIPPGDAANVAAWDSDALTYGPTGQSCERFSFTSILRPGDTLAAAGREWEVHAAAGHDPHSLILFEPDSRTLISADALWETGFGVVFPELEGVDAFTDVGRTLDLIESLNPELVIPGHGRVFTDLEASISLARQRLDHFIASPTKHALHAAKVLVKFKLLELQTVEYADFVIWARNTRYLGLLHQTYFAQASFDEWFIEVLAALTSSGVATRSGSLVIDV